MVGSPQTVKEGLARFIEKTGADEFNIAAQIYDHDAPGRGNDRAASQPSGFGQVNRPVQPDDVIYVRESFF